MRLAVLHLKAPRQPCAAPEPPHGRRAAPEPPRGRRAAPETIGQPLRRAGTTARPLRWTRTQPGDPCAAPEPPRDRCAAPEGASGCGWCSMPSITSPARNGTTEADLRARLCSPARRCSSCRRPAAWPSAGPPGAGPQDREQIAAQIRPGCSHSTRGSSQPGPCRAEQENIVGDDQLAGGGPGRGAGHQLDPGGIMRRTFEWCDIADSETQRKSREPVSGSLGRWFGLLVGGVRVCRRPGW
ncbi:hypothetical protein HDA39_001370 [Kribbella italica]|uniref:Uncharacterized protein n=1 Tax=Kribbella italica TaxID=1540520 RepID=A0A7W9J2X9_9ACTN|nr:hypothetical protein [Kribbella italica]